MMDKPQIEDLWTRLLDGQPLTTQEQGDLRESLASHPDLRDRLLEDGCIDHMLRGATTEANADAFVESLSRRLDAECAAETLPEISVAGDLVEPPVVAPPVHQLEFIAAPPVAAVRPINRQSRRGPIHRWLPVTLVASVVILAGTFALVMGGRELRQRRLASQPGAWFQPGLEEAEHAAGPRRPRTGTQPASPLVGVDDVVPPPKSPGDPFVVDQTQPVLPKARTPGDDDRPPDPFAPPPSRLVAGLPPNDSPPPRSVDPPSPSPTVAPIIARITGSKDAVWYAGAPAHSELAAGDLQLSEGSVQITMARGAVVTLTAPANLDLRTPQQVFLRRGGLTTTVPSQAIGFEVQTPCSRIVDLGTEFAVTVDDSGATAVRVLRGQVEVSATPATAVGDRWQLDAGQFKWISADAKRHLDYRLALAKAPADKAMGGTLTMNGERLEFSRPEDFAVVWARLGQELLNLRRFAPQRADGSFQGEFDLNGKRIAIRSAADMVRANQEVVGAFGQLWADAIRSTSGGDFRIDTLNDLLKSQNEMFNRFFDGAGPKPDGQPLPAGGDKGDRGDKAKPRAKRAATGQPPPGILVAGGAHRQPSGIAVLGEGLALTHQEDGK